MGFFCCYNKVDKTTIFLRGKNWHIIFLCLSLIFITSACDEESPSYSNPGFVAVESVDGQDYNEYNSNFEEPPVDIYRDPTYMESERIVKIKSKDKNEKGSIVVNEGAGVGYIYEGRKKKEVVVTADEAGQLWAVDRDGNAYEVAISQ